STRCRRSACGTSTCRSRATRSGGRFATRKLRRPSVNLQYNGEEKIPARTDTVWAFVTNPDKVGHCFPDVVEVTVRDPTHFESVVKVGVGPVRGKFTLRVELLADSAKNRLDMKVSGGGFGSAVDLTAAADIVDGGDNTTLLRWSGQAEARG